MKQLALMIVLGIAGSAVGAGAQNFPTNDPVIKAMWAEGMEQRSQAYRLSQVLMDSIGPRLTGSPGHNAAVDWALRTYASWGIPARKEQYGTWRAWRRGKTHIDLIAPRFRTLEGTMLSWSPGTRGPIDGDVILLPALADSAAYAAWLPQVRGKFVATSFGEPTCRPEENWLQLARPESVERMRTARNEARAAWQLRVQRAGSNLEARLDANG